jgi:phosphate starvation-inducible PhoH-like protein
MSQKKRKQNWLEEANNAELEKTISWRDERDKSADEQKESANSNKLKPKTKNQETYMNSVYSKTVTICSGVAGTGKTYIACGIAAEMLIDLKIEKIIIARPLVECGQRLGAFPGDLKEKTEPFMTAMLEVFGKFMTKTKMRKIKTDEVLEICPLEIMRGRTFHNSVIILDEAQNATRRQLKMFLTRFGQESKVIICGDHTQTDLPHSEGNTMNWLLDRLDHNDIGKVFLTSEDVQRHGLIKYIIEQLGE